MIGAIIGDFIGSRLEFSENLDKNFTLITEDCHFTDDSIHTIALAKVLMESGKAEDYAKALVEFSVMYPDGGYGGSFRRWYNKCHELGTVLPPYNSYGNGSAMRTAAIADLPHAALENNQWMKLAEDFASVTHNHPEGVKGAQATVAAIIMAKSGGEQLEIKNIIEDKFGYIVPVPGDIRGKYKFNEICQETVPQAIGCFVFSDSFEETIRNACSLGGDADTLAAIAGSIAYPFFKGKPGECPVSVRDAALNSLTPHLRHYVDKFALHTL